nr:MAG TPA: hypothetical protein [Caudoviricetes sp.]
MCVMSAGAGAYRNLLPTVMIICPHIAAWKMKRLSGITNSSREIGNMNAGGRKSRRNTTVRRRNVPRVCCGMAMIHRRCFDELLSVPIFHPGG